jgi:membrane-bound serine protease (ClpP class)
MLHMNRAILLALVGAIALLGSQLPVRADSTTTAPSPSQKTVVITLSGEVNDYGRDELMRKFDQARKLGATVVVLNIDTYGGLLTSGLDISRFIKRQDDVHVVAYVQDKAISAGAMIAMACDEIVVSDSASLGDCAPIIFGPEGLENMAPAERAKAVGPVLTDFNESAVRNHHDPLLAAAMVDVAHAVYWIQNDKGERKFVDQKDYDSLIATKKWTDVSGAQVPIVAADALLTVDSDQAVHYGLATAKFSSIDALTQARNYNVVADLTPGFGEEAVEFLGGAVMRGILIIVFLQCLYVVIHAPGHGVAEVLGLIALVLMLGVPLLTGYAQWWEILVIFLGLVLVSLEIILPGHIFPGVTGAILVLFGLVMTFVPAGFNGPTFLPSRDALPLVEKGLVVVASSMAISVLLWFWLGNYLPKVPVLNRLILTATSGNSPMTAASGNGARAAGIDRWPPPGAIGKALSELRPGGRAEFFDPATADKRIAFVVSESGYVEAGSEIVVREVSGPSVVVRKRE